VVRLVKAEGLWSVEVVGGLPFRWSAIVRATGDIEAIDKVKDYLKEAAVIDVENLSIEAQLAYVIE